MSAGEVDEYLAQLDEPQRSTLEHLRQTIADVIPDAQLGLSYGVPAFRISGKAVAGFSAAKHHLSYLPHSGSVLDTIDSVAFEVGEGWRTVKFLSTKCRATSAASSGGVDGEIPSGRLMYSPWMMISPSQAQ